jgi:hypothetical protein
MERAGSSAPPVGACGSPCLRACSASGRRHERSRPSPGADVAWGDPCPGADVAWGRPLSRRRSGMGRAQPRSRCDRGEPSLGADVGQGLPGCRAHPKRSFCADNGAPPSHPSQCVWHDIPFGIAPRGGKCHTAAGPVPTAAGPVPYSGRPSAIQRPAQCHSAWHPAGHMQASPSA